MYEHMLIQQSYLFTSKQKINIYQHISTFNSKVFSKMFKQIRYPTNDPYNINNSKVKQGDQDIKYILNTGLSSDALLFSSICNK